MPDGSVTADGKTIDPPGKWFASIGVDRIIDFTSEDFTRGEARYDLTVDVGGTPSLSALRRTPAPGGAIILVWPGLQGTGWPDRGARAGGRPHPKRSETRRSHHPCDLRRHQFPCGYTSQDYRNTLLPFPPRPSLRALALLRLAGGPITFALPQRLFTNRGRGSAPSGCERRAYGRRSGARGDPGRRHREGA